MGLSGRKVKQRIGADPRNLTWANDASKFGSAYLEKFGWSSGSGLGVSGDGRTKHVSVYQKLDMLGIGADHKDSRDGTAWKQSRDFENLLRRLNAGAEQTEGEEVAPKVGGFVRPAARMEDATEVPVDVEAEAGTEQAKRHKKRKHGQDKADGDHAKESRREKKKQKKGQDHDQEMDTKHKKKRRERDETESIVDTTLAAEEVQMSKLATTTPVVVPRLMRAHRARHIASKGLVSKSASAIAEILGISSSFTATPTLTTDSSYPSASSTAPDTPSLTSDAPSATDKMHDLTTSSKSVMDYFREKLAAKSNHAPASSGPSATGTPTGHQHEDERPRGGLGHAASKLRTETTEVDEDSDDRPRAGLGTLSMSMTTSMMAFVKPVAEGSGREDVGGKGPEAAKGKERKEGKRKSKKRNQANQAASDDAESFPVVAEESLVAVAETPRKNKKKKQERVSAVPGEEAKLLFDIPEEKKKRKKHSKEAESSKELVSKEQPQTGIEDSSSGKRKQRRREESS